MQTFRVFPFAMNSTHKRIPCHLLTGPLGVGKTTAVIDYLKRHAGRQFVAYLVNDFGPAGLDAAIVEGTVGQQVKDGMKVMMVPGGCICCTAAPEMISTMQKIAASPEVDRVIIEPSGLALAGDMVDLLHRLADSCNLDVRPVITLIDPKAIDKPFFQKMPYFIRMVEAANVLVANRCDLAKPEMIARFHEWSAGLYPPKLRIIVTDHGKLPDEVFELRQDVTCNTNCGHEHGEGHDHHSHHIGVDPKRAGGLIWEPRVSFASQPLEDAIRRIAVEGLDGIRIARLKGIFRTDYGWKLLEIACGEVFSRNTDYRLDNRLDWITEEGSISADQFREHLWALAQPVME